MGQETNLRDILKISRARCEEMLRVAVDVYTHGDLTQAEIILVGLAALMHDDARPLKLLGSTLLLQARHIEAEAVYENALRLDGKDPYVLVALGELKLKSYKLQDAIPLFERLFAMDPNGEHPAANRGRELVHQAHATLAGARRS